MNDHYWCIKLRLRVGMILVWIQNSLTVKVVVLEKDAVIS